jgi:hypothetical protein
MQGVLEDKQNWDENTPDSCVQHPEIRVVPRIRWLLVSRFVVNVLFHDR